MPDEAQLDESTDTDEPQKHPHGNNRGLKQAYELRDLAAQQALALKDGPLAERETMSQRAQAMAALVKAWDYASDRLRIMRNRPLPGSLRPEKPSKKQQRVKASPTEAQEDGGDHKRVLGDDVKLNRSDQPEPATMPQDEPQPEDPAKTPPKPPKPQEGSNS